MADKKHILTYAGLKKYEDELQDLKVNRRREIARRSKRQENRETYPRTPSTMLRKTSREILS